MKINDKTIEAAKARARDLGVERPEYDDFPVWYANFVNEALMSLPKENRPALVCSFDTLFRLYPDDDEITSWRGKADGLCLYNKNAIAFELRNKLNGTRHTIYHECGHLMTPHNMFPLGFRQAAEKWVGSSKGLLKEYLENGQTNELWAEAWAMYHLDRDVLPDYIAVFIEKLTNAASDENIVYESSGEDPDDDKIYL